MANHRSALKRIRQDKKKRLRNMSYRSKVKTAIKQYMQAVEKNDPGAKQLLSTAASLLQKSVGKGIHHKNSAARTLARLSRRLPSSEA